MVSAIVPVVVPSRLVLSLAVGSLWVVGCGLLVLVVGVVVVVAGFLLLFVGFCCSRYSLARCISSPSSSSSSSYSYF